MLAEKKSLCMKQKKISTPNHWVESGSSYEKSWGEGLGDPKRTRTLQEDQQSELTWTHGGVPESTEPPTKEQAWAGPRPPAHM